MKAYNILAALAQVRAPDVGVPPPADGSGEEQKPTWRSSLHAQVRVCVAGQAIARIVECCRSLGPVIWGCTHRVTCSDLNLCSDLHSLLNKVHVSQETLISAHTRKCFLWSIETMSQGAGVGKWKASRLGVKGYALRMMVTAQMPIKSFVRIPWTLLRGRGRHSGMVHILAYESAVQYIKVTIFIYVLRFTKYRKRFPSMIQGAVAVEGEAMLWRPAAPRARSAYLQANEPEEAFSEAAAGAGC